MFWTLKRSIRETFISLPETIASITHLVKFADHRIKESTTFNSMRPLKIYNSDSLIRDLNDEASRALNGIIFNQTLKMFKQLENNLQLHPWKNSRKMAKKCTERRFQNATVPAMPNTKQPAGILFSFDQVTKKIKYLMNICFTKDTTALI